MKVEWDLTELFDFGNHLRNFGKLEATFERIAKEIAEVLLQYIKGLTPKDETGKLIDGWNGNAFVVNPVAGGYEVEIVNKAEYATHVNDGHKSYNQYGGPYKIHNRIKVVSPYQWQKGSPTYYVFGHFFVERGIEQLTNTKEIEQIIMKELQKWWDSV